MTPMEPTRRLVVDHDGEARDDEVIVEEPLEIRIAGETISVTMRTPGHDVELVFGFLCSEGIIARADDVSSLTHCTSDDRDADARMNTIDVALSPGVKAPVDPDTGMLVKRGTLMSSACGVCGRVAIDDLVARITPLPPAPPIPRGVVLDAVRALRDRQPLFAGTGACHAASVVAGDGEHVATFEDVGRHNAVDKAIGRCLRAGALPLARHVLVVSGRTSFEIVQKAVMARIPVVAGVSAATSLAVDLARRANVTLAGFVRGGAMTVYTGSALSA